MKTLCTVTVTLLLSLLCVVLPREVWAMENAMLEQIKSAADAAVERMKVLQTKEAKTDEQKQLARELLIYAKANAEAASVLLRLPSPEGGGISQEQAENMQKIGSLSRAVLKTAAVIAQGDTVTAGQDLDKLAAMMDGLLVLEEDTITLEEMLAIKAAADEAVEEAKLRLEQATTPEERELAEQLLAYAEGNAEIAAAFLQIILEGGSIARNLAEECAAAAQAVKEGTAAMVAGDFSRARAVVEDIADSLQGFSDFGRNIADGFGRLGKVIERGTHDGERRDRKKIKIPPIHLKHDHQAIVCETCGCFTLFYCDYLGSKPPGCTNPRPCGHGHKKDCKGKPHGTAVLDCAGVCDGNSVMNCGVCTLPPVSPVCP